MNSCDNGLSAQNQPLLRDGAIPLTSSRLGAGELYDQIQRKGRLSPEDSKFYGAEILLILDYLRQQGASISFVFFYAHSSLWGCSMTHHDVKSSCHRLSTVT